jgi:exosortase
MTSQITIAGRPVRLDLLVGVSALAAGLTWAYWPALGQMAHRWWHDPLYSHGYLVPVFALVLLWLREEHRAKVTFRPNWWGLLLIAAGGLLSLPGAYLYLDALHAVSLLPCIAGVFLLLGGWPALRWGWPAVAFLAFMLPLPFSVERGLAGPLQQIATTISTYTLQTLGFPAFADGNVILVNETKLEVAEACSGLGMLITFFALSTAVALLLPRGWVDKLVVLASAIPIAVVSNVFRVTVTGILQEMAGPQWGKLFHDWAGWVMMVFGLVLLWVELWILAHLFPEMEEDKPVAIGLTGGPPARPNASVARPRKSDASATTT